MGDEGPGVVVSITTAQWQEPSVSASIALGACPGTGVSERTHERQKHKVSNTRGRHALVTRADWSIRFYSHGERESARSNAGVVGTVAGAGDVLFPDPKAERVHGTQVQIVRRQCSDIMSVALLQSPSQG